MNRIARAFAGLALPVWLAGTCHSLAAQETRAFRYDGTAYATFGIGKCQHGVLNGSFAGGGEAFLWRGLTAGGEVGYYRFADSAGGFGIATANLGYHFVNRSHPGQFDPFVSVGLAGLGFTGSGRAPAASLGGGLTYWFSRRFGLRTEVRVAGVDEEGIGMFRIGISFR